jgi:hypothetical protein
MDIMDHIQKFWFIKIITTLKKSLIHSACIIIFKKLETDSI